MRALRRRAIGFAALAATGAVLMGTASAAQAQRPEKLGDGIKTGQMGVQMFNYGTYMNNGGNLGPNPPALGISPACATSTSSECRWERLEKLFAFLQRKGVTNIELFGHANFPAATDFPGLARYRALMDRFGIHAGGWHGSMNEGAWDERVAAAKILGADYIGSGGVADPGIETYGAVLASAQALNRLGKRSVEAGVGPAYIHNHEQEFDRKYVDDGVLKTAFDILLERTDPRYVVAELDVFWSSDAHDDVTGTASAAILNRWGNRIQLMHVKDGINIAGRSATSSRAGSPRATGTGELDFRPIFQAGNNRVRYYHQEQDGGTLTDADISFTNLKGAGPTAVGTALALPTTFPSVPAGTPAANNTLPIEVANTGDAPLTVTNVQIQSVANLLENNQMAQDFSIVSHDCGSNQSPRVLAPGDPANAVPRGTCTVNVGFKPQRTNTRSIARLNITSSSDNATEGILLTGVSTGDAISGVGADVPSMLQLHVPAGSFGSFVPGIAREYTTALGATVTATTADAKLTMIDSSGTPAHMSNGPFTLASPLTFRSLRLGEPTSTPFVPMAADGAPATLEEWSSPVSNENVTVGFRQAIGAAEPLRAGTYSKTLTFTLSTTTP